MIQVEQRRVATLKQQPLTRVLFLMQEVGGVINHRGKAITKSEHLFEDCRGIDRLAFAF